MGARTAATAAGAAALAAVASVAGAQSWEKDSSPLLIHAIAPPPSSELIARRGEPLLAQRVTSVRNTRLKATAPTLMALVQQRDYPAGTELYGIQAPDGWIYCAAARTWLLDQQTVCYQDMDQDGAFDRVRNSGIPFANVPLLAHEFGAHKPLPQPVPYEELPLGEGPAIEYVIRWKAVNSKGRNPSQRSPAVSIRWGGGLRVGTRTFDLADGPQISLQRLGANTRLPLDVLGAKVIPLGLTEDGSLRYRVERTMPSQIMRIHMTMTVTTSYYFYVY